MWLDNYDSN